MYIDESTVREKYWDYAVGYNPKIKKYLLAVTYDGIMVYERYFEISEDEYEMFGSDELDSIVEGCREKGTRSTRFLFSILNSENTVKQSKMRDQAKI